METIIDKIERFNIQINLKWLVRCIKKLILYCRNDYKIGERKTETNYSYEWVITGFIIDYYPNVGLIIQNQTDKKWFDTCSSKRWERDFKQFKQ